MTQIDNIKMWESLIKISKEGDNLIGDREITLALKEQGLEYKDGHIISITEPNADFKIEKGKWYMCIKSNENFTCGKVYKAVEDFRIADDNGKTLYFSIIGIPYREYFRPATEEEINKHLFVEEEMEHIKGYREKALEMLDKIEKECEEKMTELDGIQKIIYDLLSSTNGEWLEEEYLTEMSKNISEDIRKQIAESIEVESFCDKTKIYYSLSSISDIAWYKKGIRDVLKKIKEG